MNHDAPMTYDEISEEPDNLIKARHEIDFRRAQARAAKTIPADDNADNAEDKALMDSAEALIEEDTLESLKKAVKVCHSVQHHDMSEKIADCLMRINELYKEQEKAKKAEAEKAAAIGREQQQKTAKKKRKRIAVASALVVCIAIAVLVTQLVILKNNSAMVLTEKAEYGDPSTGQNENQSGTVSGEETQYKDASINGVAFSIPVDWEEDTAAEAEESSARVICGVYKYICDGAAYKCMVRCKKTGNSFGSTEEVQAYLESITADPDVSEFSDVIKNEMTTVSGVPAADVEYSFTSDKVNSYFYMYIFTNGSDTITVTIACPLGSEDQYADVVDHVVNSFDLPQL